MCPYIHVYIYIYIHKALDGGGSFFLGFVALMEIKRELNWVIGWLMCIIGTLCLQ